MGFFDIFTQMEETLEKKQSSETLGTGLKRVGILLLVIGIILGLFAQVASSLPGLMGASLNIGGIPPIILVPILLLILGIIISLVSNGILLVVAKLLGGRGQFGQQYGVSTLTLWPSVVILVIAYFIMGILTAISPTIGMIIGLIVLYPALFLVTFLGSYFNIIYLKSVHGLTTFKAALSIAIFITVLLIIFILLFGALILSMLGGLPSPSY